MYIGIDLGGTNIDIGVVAEDGVLKYKNSIPTKRERTVDAIIKDIINLINVIIKENSFSREQIRAIGVGIPGIAQAVTGKVIYCINLNWSDVPLKEIMEKSLGIPTFVDNDATLAGLAEYESGSMKNVKSGVFITIGTGIGGGIVMDKKIQSGFHGIGSEIGHMIVGENYYDCNCGRNGCLETFASATALIKYTKKLIREGIYKTTITQKINGNLDNINGRLVFEAAEKGDCLANKAVDRLVKYLSIAIINMTTVIDPEIFVLGGGIAKAGTFLLDKIRKEVNKNRYYKMMPIGKIVLSNLGSEAGIIGAAALGNHNSKLIKP